MGKRLLIFGPPAAGKGTHAKRLANDLSIPHIATGDMLRQAMRAGQGTPTVGAAAAEGIGRGELAPDDLVIGLLEGRLERPDAQDGYLLDGFPRTLPQAEALQGMLAAQTAAVDGVLCLDAPEEMLVNRVAGRFTCSDCQAVFNRYYRPPQAAGRCDLCGGTLSQRADDAEVAVRRRLEQYRAKTAPVLAFFAAQHWPVRTVTSVGPVDEIYERLRAAVKN